MSEKKMTLAEIRREGIDALRERLGVDGMIRFFQLLCPETGDYTKDRHKWLDHLTVDDIKQEIDKMRKEKGYPFPSEIPEE